jgi:hypothetical protein
MTYLFQKLAAVQCNDIHFYNDIKILLVFVQKPRT